MKDPTSTSTSSTQSNYDLLIGIATAPRIESPLSFSGTDNPRHLRVLAALLCRPRRREDIDRIAGCSNGPELIAELRRRGLGKNHLRCERISFIDRDGKPCQPGVYSLTDHGKRLVRAWLARLSKASTMTPQASLEMFHV